MRYLLNTLYIIFAIFVLYIIILFLFPSVWIKVDKLTSTNISSWISDRIDYVTWKWNYAMDSTDDLIDNFWSNTKNIQQQKLKAIEELRK